MRSVLAAALLAASVLVTPAIAQEGCAPLDVVKAWLSERAPVIGYVKLDEAQTARVLRWHNSVPPETNDRYDLIVVVRLQGGAVGLIRGNGGKVCEPPVLVRDELVPGLLGAIAGERA